MITLGVIGIVAAMTLPVLTAKYQEKVINSQFKRAYSNMSNALRMMQAKLGEIPQCYYTSGNQDGGTDRTQVAACETFYEEFAEQMKILKVCKGRAYRDGCIPKYNGVDTIKKYEDTDTIIGCSGYSQSTILNRNYAYVFNDGTILFLYDSLPGWGSVFALDVNGKKGPNKWGYDVFSFAWREKGNFVVLRDGTCTLIEEGGRRAADLLLNVK